MNKPNILIFMTDHQRADTVLPDHPTLTPNVTGLAEEGVTFGNHFCPSPHCCPSRATFFTGLYPSRHGIWNNIANEQALSTGLNDGVRLWSEDLAGAGYKLHYSGKWHVSMEESPEDRGWQEHFLSSSAKVGTHHGTNWEHFKQLAEQPYRTIEDRHEGEIIRPGYRQLTLYGSSGEIGDSHDEQAVNAGLAVLDSVANDTDPWCLYVGVNGPHDPYTVPQKYLDMYDIDDIELPVNFADNMRDKPRIYQRMRDTRFGQFTEYEVRQCIRHFRAFCTYMDDLFGKLLNKLDDIGQAENTIVIYCSDHGDYCGEHGLFAKGIPCFNGAYHVPLVVRWPAGISNGGRRVEAFSSLADIAPTLLDCIGIQVDRYFSGASLLPFLKNETPQTWRDAMFTQCNGVEIYFKQRSVRTKDFKYVFNAFDYDELYDLRADPYEMRNVVADPIYADVVRQMCKRLWQFAYQEDDNSLLNAYITVALAPYGPAEAFTD